MPLIVAGAVIVIAAGVLLTIFILWSRPAPKFSSSSPDSEMMEPADLGGGEKSENSIPSPRDSFSNAETAPPYQNPPANQTPWAQGPSDQTSNSSNSASGNSPLPSDQVPWGQGPSQ